MMHRRGLIACLTTALLAGSLMAADAVQSGPQVGQKVPGPFHPLNVNGEFAGKKNCLYCQNGTNPVAMVFAREMSPALMKLIKKIDAATAKNETAHMGSFVVFLSDSDALAAKLKSVVEKEGIKHTILSVDNAAGPPNYKVAQKADVTVVFYTDHTVKANYAFAKGQLNDKDIDAVVAGISKIVPAE